MTDRANRSAEMTEKKSREDKAYCSVWEIREGEGEGEAGGAGVEAVGKRNDGKRGA